MALRLDSPEERLLVLQEIVDQCMAGYDKETPLPGKGVVTTHNVDYSTAISALKAIKSELGDEQQTAGDITINIGLVGASQQDDAEFKAQLMEGVEDD